MQSDRKIASDRAKVQKKLRSIRGRLYVVVSRRRGKSWIMSPPRLATPEEIQQAAADGGWREDFFAELHAGEQRDKEDAQQRRWMNRIPFFPSLDI